MISTVAGLAGMQRSHSLSLSARLSCPLSCSAPRLLLPRAAHGTSQRSGEEGICGGVESRNGDLRRLALERFSSRPVALSSPSS